MANQTAYPGRAARRRSLRILVGCLLVLAATLGFALPPHQVAAEGERCFGAEVPGVTACVDGQFLEFWEANGGVAVFGYPLAPAEPRTTADGTFLTQYFERARFELHPENPAPYNVLLGRLGAERLAALGQPWTMFEPEAELAGCQFWPATRHNVCGVFLDAWRSYGVRLDDDPSASEAKRLALWGLPLSSSIASTSAAGLVLTQWFERARIEQQPDGTITLGRLGAEQLEALASPPATALPASEAAPLQATPAPTAEPASPVPQATPAPTAEAAPPVPQATPAPAAPSVPFPGEPCQVNVPTPAEGLQLWMVDPAPMRLADAVACVRLIVGGETARGANAQTYRYRSEERRPSIPQSTGADGVASFIFYIGEEPAGVRIPVEAVVTYRGVTYTAYAEFTPQ